MIRNRAEYPNVHGLLIVKDERLIYEEYFTGEDRRHGPDGWWQPVTVEFERETLHDIRSAGKSVTSALLGIALGAGDIPSLDVPVADYFPEHAAVLTLEKRRITLRHALTMSAGLEWNEGDVSYTDSSNDAERMHANTDPASFVFSRGIAAEPGTTWAYNSGLPLLVGLVVSRSTGRPFGAYAREKLFDPLGITEVEWGGALAWRDIAELTWEGTEPWARVASPEGAIWMRPRDLAKFGMLYLSGGRWNGHQVIPADWVATSTRRRLAVKESESEYGEHGYSYFWWHDRFRTPGGELEVHSAVGNGEQRVFVIPALSLVVVHLAGRYNEDADWMSERLLLNHIVPAMRGDAPHGAGGSPVTDEPGAKDSRGVAAW